MVLDESVDRSGCPVRWLEEMEGLGLYFCESRNRHDVVCGE